MPARDNDDELESEGVPALHDAINDDEGLLPPRDYPTAVEDYGITADEQRVPEPLADFVAREEPDIVPADGVMVGRDTVGRLVAPDGGNGIDTEAAEVATESEDDAGLSAEEAAMHV